MLGASKEFNPQTIQNSGMNIMELLCEAFSQPVAIIIRPFYGTRYYSVISTFIAMVMMLFLPAFLTVTQSIAHMIPFANVPMPRGMFSLGDFAELYYTLALIHGVRLWRRMMHPDCEDYSEYEGPALPIFHYLLKSGNFYFVRVVWEPAAVLIAAIVLQDMFIIQAPLALYLKFAALCMAMRSFIAWFRRWEVERTIRDNTWAGQVISKIADGTASQSEREQVLIASIPKASVPNVATDAHAARITQ
jgi:hypothetical protein